VETLARFGSDLLVMEPAASCQCWWDVDKVDVDVVAGVIDVAQEIKQAIEDFKPYIPLIQGLRNPGMRQRHWDIVRSISCIIRYDNDPLRKHNAKITAELPA